MPKVELRGVELYYSLDGQGPETIVVLNGIMMNTLSWNEFVPVFTAKGVTAFCGWTSGIRVFPAPIPRSMICPSM